jgi:hypothetical protein
MATEFILQINGGTGGTMACEYGCSFTITFDNVFWFSVTLTDIVVTAKPRWTITILLTLERSRHTIMNFRF